MGNKLQDFQPVNGEFRRWPRWFAGLSRWCLLRAGWRAEGTLASYNKSIFVVAPHTSNWDFVVGIGLVFALQLPITFLAKHTLFKSPFGRLFGWLGGIPVDRNNARNVVNQVADAFARRQHMLLAITPEGTRRPVFPWKNGFMRIAEEANCPVQCVGLDYKTKNIIFGPVLTINGKNRESQMHRIYVFYANIQAKHPQNCITTEPKA